MPRGVLGLNSAMFKEYLRFIANRRCPADRSRCAVSGSGEPVSVDVVKMMDLKKERNFFETRVTEYQTGGALSWD
jgi:ribonucleoside-diphosphate reductase beta chain